MNMLIMDQKGPDYHYLIVLSFCHDGTFQHYNLNLLHSICLSICAIDILPLITLNMLSIQVKRDKNSHIFQ